MIMVAAVWAATPFFTSCSDSEEEDNEYTTSFVYLQRNDYLDDEKVFIITHNSITGLGGKVDMPFRVKVQRPTSVDVTVNLAVQTSEGLEGKIVLKPVKCNRKNLRQVCPIYHFYQEQKML